MANQQKPSGIAWCDATFNPVRGWGPDGERVFSAPGWEAQFDAWERKAAKAGKPMRIFVNSMWDPGEGPDVDGKEGRDGPRPEYLPVLNKLVEIARRCPHLRLQMLTKRPWNLVEWWRGSDFRVWPANLWVGVSVEDQPTADERIPWLLQMPAAVLFLSMEPLLGAVELPFCECELNKRPGICVECNGYGDRADCDRCGGGECPRCDGEREHSRISWVITGAENSPKARPMDLAWVRSLRDQCVAAGVPFFLKQAMEGGEVVSLPTLDGKVWDEFPAEAS